MLKKIILFLIMFVCIVDVEEVCLKCCNVVEQVVFVPPGPLHPHIYSNGHICLGNYSMFLKDMFVIIDLVCYHQTPRLLDLEILLYYLLYDQTMFLTVNLACGCISHSV